MPDIDKFCPTATSDPYWNESSWFSFSVPELNMHGLIYYFFRPNMKLLMGGPIIWDGTGEASWNCLYYDWHHIQPMPMGEKYNFEAPNGLAVAVLDPHKRYRIGYAGKDLRLELDWTAIIAPHHFLGMEIEATGATAENRMHFEQMGRVVGQIELRGQVYRVDCFSLRDGSWGRRQLDAAISNSYFWAIISEDAGFHAMMTGEGDEQRLVGGFLLRDGVVSTFVKGRRFVQEMGRYTPKTFSFSAEDELGRKVEAVCRPSSDFLFCGFPRLQVTWSLLEVDFSDGTRGLGDLQECLPLEKFKARQRHGVLSAGRTESSRTPSAIR